MVFITKSKSKGEGSTKDKGINWRKSVIPLFIILIILLAFLVSYVLMSLPAGKTSISSRTLTLEKNFNTLSDGLKLVPDNASYVRFANMSKDSQLSAFMSQNFYNDMPKSSVVGGTLDRDMLTLYPQNYFGNFSAEYPGYNSNLFSIQYVSVSDFGTVELNRSYQPKYTVDGQPVSYVSPLYYFTPQSDPVVSGMIDMVKPTIDTMTGNVTTNAYDTYGSLIDQLGAYGASENGMTLEVAGNGSRMNFSDKYYAGIGPNNDADQTYSFQAILHLNRSLTNEDQMYMSYLPEVKMQNGFESYNISYTNGNMGDYVIVKAKGDFNNCTLDLYNWGFLKD